MSARTLLALLVAVSVAIAMAPGATGGTAHFDVDLAPAIDTPDRPETILGTTYTLTQLGRVDPGGTVDATVTVGSGTDYQVEVIDAQRQRMFLPDEGTGDGTKSIDMSVPPGSYVVAVWVDGVYEDIEPAVVSQYRVQVGGSVPTEATEGSTINVSATLDEVSGSYTRKTLDYVQVVVGDADGDVVERLSDPDGDDTYTGSVDVSSLSTGQYTLYVVARGTEEGYGDRNELLGASDAQSFEVTEQTTTTTTTTTTSSSTGGGGGGGGGGAAPPETTTTTDSTATTTAVTTTATTSTEAPDGTTEGPTDSGGSTTDAGGGDSTTTEDDGGVITPNTPTATTTASSPTEPPAGQPGFGVGATLAALAALSALAGRRLR